MSDVSPSLVIAQRDARIRKLLKILDDAELGEARRREPDSMFLQPGPAIGYFLSRYNKADRGERELMRLYLQRSIELAMSAYVMVEDEVMRI